METHSSDGEENNFDVKMKMKEGTEVRGIIIVLFLILTSTYSVHHCPFFTKILVAREKKMFFSFSILLQNMLTFKSMIMDWILNVIISTTS